MKTIQVHALLKDSSLLINKIHIKSRCKKFKRLKKQQLWCTSGHSMTNPLFPI